MAGTERILARVSDDELARRWALIRRDMADQGIDALVMQASNDWLGGYVKWFTDIPANNGYPRTVVFHADDLMTVVEMGPSGVTRDLDGSDPIRRGVGRILHSPSFLSIGYTHGYDARLIVDELKGRACRRVGLVGAGAMAHGLASALAAELTGAGTRMVDATDLADRHKAIKSAEETALIRQTAAMAGCRLRARPGGDPARAA